MKAVEIQVSRQPVADVKDGYSRWGGDRGGARVQGAGQHRQDKSQQSQTRTRRHGASE
jgi:hypothetical protein